MNRSTYIVALIIALTITALILYLAVNLSINGLSTYQRLSEQHPEATKGICFIIIYASLLFAFWQRRRNSKIEIEKE